MQLCISNTLIAGIAIAMMLLLGVVFHPIVALICGIGLFTVATAIIHLNAEAYVKSLATSQHISIVE